MSLTVARELPISPSTDDFAEVEPVTAHNLKTVRASSVCIENKGAFAMSWWFHNMDKNTEGRYTWKYSNPFKRCMEPNAWMTEPGDELIVYAHAVAGKTVEAEKRIIYDI